jgi:putative ABC transport system ATP-binding protein
LGESLNMLKTAGLAYRYPQGPLLAYPDLDLPSSGTLLIGGVSGSGKSTLLGLMTGFLRPAQGWIRVAGQDLAELDGARLDVWRGRHVGFMPQRLYLHAQLSVMKNLQLAGFAAGLPVSGVRCHELLAQVGLEAHGHRAAGALSVGQMQRLALVRALLHQPQLLVADEPTASLDDANALNVIELLVRTACDVGAALVVATHDARVRQYLEQSAPGVQHCVVGALS